MLIQNAKAFIDGKFQEKTDLLIRDGRIIRYLTLDEGGLEPAFYTALDDRVLLLTLIPGMGAQALERLRDSYQAVILQSFGVGGLPGGDKGELARALKEWLDAGKTVVMMTQVSYEGSDMTVYQVGHDLKERFGLMEAYNMTMEAAVTKLMWAMGQSSRPEEIRRMFYRPVQFDIIR